MSDVESKLDNKISTNTESLCSSTQTLVHTILQPRINCHQFQEHNEMITCCSNPNYHSSQERGRTEEHKQSQNNFGLTLSRLRNNGRYKTILPYRGDNCSRTPILKYSRQFQSSCTDLRSQSTLSNENSPQEILNTNHHRNSTQIHEVVYAKDSQSSVQVRNENLKNHKLNIGYIIEKLPLQPYNFQNTDQQMLTVPVFGRKDKTNRRFTEETTLKKMYMKSYDESKKFKQVSHFNIVISYINI